MTKIQQELFALQDEKYQSFQGKLVPNIDAQTIIGVRVPQLRALAKQFYRQKEDYNIEGILSGEADSLTYERMIKAEVDERICVTELISDKIFEEAKIVYETMENSEILNTHITNAIDFMVDCFGEKGSAELLLLVTELSMKKEAYNCL